jgi:hypothetical protein
VTCGVQPQQPRLREQCLHQLTDIDLHIDGGLQVYVISERTLHRTTPITIITRIAREGQIPLEILMMAVHTRVHVAHPSLILGRLQRLSAERSATHFNRRPTRGDVGRRHRALGAAEAGPSNAFH